MFAYQASISDDYKMWWKALRSIYRGVKIFAKKKGEVYAAENGEEKEQELKEKGEFENIHNLYKTNFRNMETYFKASNRLLWQQYDNSPQGKSNRFKNYNIAYNYLDMLESELLDYVNKRGLLLPKIEARGFEAVEKQLLGGLGKKK